MARRLKQTCKLLTDTTESIERIANEVGLTNFSYFCRFFKSRIGMTPFQFRKQFAEKD
ncbi:helix-turn-helix domain-containing protein [Paenibacillus sp. GYB003]|uniref:helix-turn-helix domain-containing protein n=1 Tax=Paenibacillus sp. GYB003 TaxID=2994392 RepID=UPI003FA77172